MWCSGVSGAQAGVTADALARATKIVSSHAHVARVHEERLGIWRDAAQIVRGLGEAMSELNDAFMQLRDGPSRGRARAALEAANAALVLMLSVALGGQRRQVLGNVRREHVQVDSSGAGVPAYTLLVSSYKTDATYASWHVNLAQVAGVVNRTLHCVMEVKERCACCLSLPACMTIEAGVLASVKACICMHAC